MSVTVNMRELLQSGAHFGHQTRRWNPKMRPFIFGARNGVHIIDLQKTVKEFQKACDFVESLTARGGHVLFVGTKRQARDIIATEAKRSGMYFVNHRWLGGTLTNYSTIRQGIHRLKRIEKMSEDGTYAKLPKREVLEMERERFKLERSIGGIKDMPGLPHAVFVVDAHKETTTIKEANRLGIKVVALTDTNADPSGIDFVIPGNDDSTKSLQLFVHTIAEACLAGKLKSKDKSDDLKTYDSVETGSFYDDQGHAVAVEKVNYRDFDSENDIENEGTTKH